MSSSEALIEEGRRVREALVSKRSDILVRLFDLILDASVRGCQLTEVELVSAIRNDALGSDSSPRPNIRVYVLRLRRKLDDYYKGRPGARLIIPRSEYRMVLAPPEAVLSTARKYGDLSRLLSRRMLFGMAVVLLLNVVLTLYTWRKTDTSLGPLADSVFWRVIASKSQIPTVLFGDYFLLAEKRGSDNPINIVRDLAISSPKEFHQLINQNDKITSGLVDLDLHFVSSSVVLAMRNLWSALHAVDSEMPLKVAVKSASQLTPEIFASSDVVYVGPLDGLSNLIGAPLRQMSGFEFGPRYKNLIDKKSGRHFLSDGVIPVGNQIPRREYGYIAVFPGPSGNYILVISGTGDAATIQMTDLVGNKVALEKLRKKLGGNLDSFEALYQVRTMYSQNYSSALVLVRPLKTEGAWDKSMLSSSTDR